MVSCEFHAFGYQGHRKNHKMLMTQAATRIVLVLTDTFSYHHFMPQK